MTTFKDGNISQHLQDSFVYLCITSDDFIKIVRYCLEPDYFTSPVLRNCITICFDFWDEHKQAPKDHFQDELVRRLPDIPEADHEFYVDYLKKLAGFSPPSTNYVIRRLSDFCRHREFEGAALKFAELVSDERYDDAEAVMYSALKTGIGNENVGIRYLTDFSNLLKRGDGPDILCSTGIEDLDTMILGYSRAQLLCVLGGYKGKKSWYLQHLARTATMAGLKVLYISHEMGGEQVEKRMDRVFGSMVKTRNALEINIKSRDRLTGEFTQSIHLRPSVYDVEAVMRVRKSIRRSGGNIIIKKYPMGTCTLGELQRYLDYLERFEEFVPDVLINDYIEIMDLRGGELRHKINEMYIGHKMLADERNMLVVTASQGNKDAIRKKRPSQKDVAEDVRKLGNVDTMVAVCQTDDMVPLNLASAWVVVNRDDVMDVGCTVLMNLDIGQFCMSSWSDMG